MKHKKIVEHTLSPKQYDKENSWRIKEVDIKN